MIRSATDKDIPRIVEMGKRFRNETAYSGIIRENPEQFIALGQQLLSVDGLLVAEQDNELVGMLGFIIHKHFMSGDLTAGEIFWWVEPEHRGEGLRLLREAENQARIKGAKYMQMIAPTEKVASVYERLGYSYVETTYQRAL